MGFNARQLSEYFVEWLNIMKEHPEGITHSELSRFFYERHPEITGKKAKDNLRAALGHIRSNCRRIDWVYLDGALGKWFLTNAGKEALAAWTDPHELVKEAAQKRKRQDDLREKLPEQENDSIQDEQNESAAEISAEATFEDAQETARKNIREFLFNINEYEFQRVVADLLKATGCHVHWIAPPGPDGGCDIIAFVDQLGIQSPIVKVQVKRQQSKATVSMVKSFSANLGPKDVGIFLCLGGFTGDAEYFARSCSCQLTLMDLERFLNLWIANMGKLSDEAKDRFNLEPIYYIRPKVE